ncbi:MAG: ATP-binding protein [Steroidobacteraceae bacterium]
MRRLRPYLLIAAWVVLGGIALLALAKSAQNSAQFSRWQPWILLVNVLALVMLVVLLSRKLLQLLRDYRNQVPGSRLTLRTVGVFSGLVVAPLLVVYLFSLEFLNRGIDSWFRVEIRQGLNDAVVLSRAALDLRIREHVERTERLAADLGTIAESRMPSVIDTERRNDSALEIAVYGPQDRLLAISGAALDVIPERPAREIVRQVGGGQTYVSLEPAAKGQYVIRTAAPIPGATPNSSRYVLVVHEVPAQLAALTDAVQSSYSQYGDLAALREPLKNIFRLTLTLVLLVAMLAAIYGAIESARRLVRPVQDLIAGTRAVGKGDFATRLPLPSRDEMGFLVHSFNDMTKRLRRARAEADRNQQQLERQRAGLAVILARLSSGVIVIDKELRLRVANDAAGAILGVDLTAAVGLPLAELRAGSARLEQLVAALLAHFAADRDEWREQLELDGEAGARVLMCTCTRLPRDSEEEPGYVVVFDDLTALLNAQRDAAWGEVARRLAHEIKNPLTPIQLSAERMRRRLMQHMQAEDADVLERGTRTIIQQVDTMKQMVNAFSEYARAPETKLSRFDFDELVREVAELYQTQDPAIAIVTELAGVLWIEADRGRLRQVLNNLLTNAVESLSGVAGARIEISTSRIQRNERAYVRILIRDNGPGIARELLGRVFDPYVTSKPKGTGLGLAIVKKTVEEHGGSISADNIATGGACVTLELPLRSRIKDEHAAAVVESG